MTNAIREALAYACDCSLAEVAEALLLYGQYPRDGLGRKVNAAEEMAETCRIALASLEQASTPSVEAVADVRVPFGSTLGYCHWRGPVPPAGTELYTHPPIPAPESAEPTNSKGAEQ